MAGCGPHHQLDEIKRQVALDAFWVHKRDFDELVRAIGTIARARAFVAATIQALGPNNYSDCAHLQWENADEYGIDLGGSGWYIKLSIDEHGEVSVISFHPPRFPMQTTAGTVSPLKKP